MQRRWGGPTPGGTSTGLTLELQAGDSPALAFVQGANRIRVDLFSVKGLVAALTDAAADLAGVLATGGFDD